MNTPTSSMRSLIEAAAIPGASLAVLRHGRVEDCIALGVRDRQLNEPVNDQTAFHVASLTKPPGPHPGIAWPDARVTE